MPSPDPPGLIISEGSRVRFKPGPASKRLIDGKVLRWRSDPRGGSVGWLDVACDDGVERSVRPNGAELIL